MYLPALLMTELDIVVFSNLLTGQEDQPIHILLGPCIKTDGHLGPEVAAPLVEVALGDEILRGRFLHRRRHGVDDALVADVESHVSRLHIPVG